MEGVLGRASNASPFGARSAADRALVALLFRGLVRVRGACRRRPREPLGRQRRWVAWTFHLRGNLRWQDGEPLTADDVAFTVDVLRGPVYTGPGAESWRDVSAMVVDQRTVSLKLTTPLGGFLQAATQPIAPAHLLAGIPPDALPDDRSARCRSDGTVPAGVPRGRAGIARRGDPVERRTRTRAAPTSTPAPTDSLATARPTVRADAAIPYIGRFELRYFDDIESLIDAWAEGELDAVSGFQPADVAALQAASRGVSLAAPGTTILRRTSTSGPVGASSRTPRSARRSSGQSTGTRSCGTCWWAGFPADR